MERKRGSRASVLGTQHPHHITRLDNLGATALERALDNVLAKVAEPNLDTVLVGHTEGRQTVLIRETEHRAEVVNLNRRHVKDVRDIIAKVRVTNNRDVTIRRQD